MEESILKSTKKILGMADDYTTFDLDVITHLNSALAVLNQLGVGPAEGFMIEDDGPVWEDLDLPVNQLSMVKSYIYLKVRMLFDPPTTSFLIAAMEKQIAEHEGRISMLREDTIPIPETPPSDGEVVFVPLPSYMEGGYDA